MTDRPTKLSDADVREALLKLEGWTLEDTGGAIKKTFTFKDFGEAFGFMANCALYAERNDHHPEWFNVYNRVEVRLTTHDAGGLTMLDVDTALHMNRTASV